MKPSSPGRERRQKAEKTDREETADIYTPAQVKTHCIQRSSPFPDPTAGYSVTAN